MLGIYVFGHFLPYFLQTLSSGKIDKELADNYGFSLYKTQPKVELKFFFQILPADGYTTNRRNGSVKLRREDIGLGSEEPISVPTLLRETADAYPEVSPKFSFDRFFPQT